MVPASLANLYAMQSPIDLSGNQLTTWDPALVGNTACSSAPLSGSGALFKQGISCSSNLFTCVPPCLSGQCSVSAVCASPSPPPSLAGIGGCAASDNAVDCAALLAAYVAWGSKPASWAPGIAAGTSYCAWDTSTIQSCTGGRVTTLNIYTDNSSPTLTPGSTIPPSLGSLAALTTLRLVNLAGNGGSSRLGFYPGGGLVGTIPASLGSLTSLQSLGLYSNLLTGTIPDTFKSLSSLGWLALDCNFLTGTIPTWLGSLTSLSGMCATPSLSPQPISVRSPRNVIIVVRR